MVAVVVSGDATECIPLLDDNGSGVYSKGRNSIIEFRKEFMGSFLQHNGTPFAFRNGILCPTFFSLPGGGVELFNDGLVQSTGGAGTQAVNIKAARFMTQRTGQGPYIVSQETDLISLAQPAADGANPRWDLICVMPYDKGAFPADAQHGPKYITVTGDPLGSPVVPALPAAVADATIIAQILRAANDNTIAAADITDVRKGTGLHGSPRVLLPGDLLSDSGTYYGETRLRTGTFVNTIFRTAGAKVMIDYWDAVNSVWRGQTPGTIKLDATTFAGNAGITNGTTVTMGTTAIPDPGYPYRLRISGEFIFSGANNAGLIFQARDGAQGGASLFFTPSGLGWLISRNNEAAGAAAGRNVSPSGLSTNILTGARTVYAVAIGAHNGAASADVLVNSWAAYEIVPA